MKMKKILSSALALSMTLSMSVTAFALDATSTDLTSSGSEATVPVELTAEAVVFSVSVPMGLPVAITADGVVTVAENAQIVNNSGAPVKISNLTVTAKDTWTTADFDTFDASAAALNTKEFSLKVNVTCPPNPTTCYVSNHLRF